ncbi:2'-5' RNA ligase family protein [Kitasatospora sp. NPDC087315]|uniref:2'-5' RNA ligase family protein n=1 Tax=Kitasatospora sp. NPDC087315 TaxID=3364069 RepID=UPI0037FF05C6
MLLTDTRAFPPRPPASLDNPEIITAHDHAAFDVVEVLKNHWERPGWDDERRALYWLLTFPDEADLIGSARFCQEALAGLALDPVPSDGLHVTLARVGEAADVSTRMLDSLTAAVEDAGPRSFEVTAQPLSGSMGAVRFSLGPWRGLVELHQMLTVCGRRAGVPGGRGTSAFRPHLSIAYSSAAQPAAPVVERVRGLRDRPAVPLRIARVDLVELRREDHVYRWDVLRQVVLR